MPEPGQQKQDLDERSAVCLSNDSVSAIMQKTGQEAASVYIVFCVDNSSQVC